MRASRFPVQKVGYDNAMYLYYWHNHVLDSPARKSPCLLKCWIHFTVKTYLFENSLNKRFVSGIPERWKNYAHNSHITKWIFHRNTAHVIWYSLRRSKLIDTSNQTNRTTLLIFHVLVGSRLLAVVVQWRKQIIAFSRVYWLSSVYVKNAEVLLFVPLITQIKNWILFLKTTFCPRNQQRKLCS